MWRKRARSEEHTSELQSRFDIVCRLLLEKKNRRRRRRCARRMPPRRRSGARAPSYSTAWLTARMSSVPAPQRRISCVFFFNDTAPTEIYTLSLHDALPIFVGDRLVIGRAPRPGPGLMRVAAAADEDRKSTRLNSRHVSKSYADFCLKK